MPFLNGLLFPFFDFIAKNRWAQIVIGLGIFWLIFMAYLAMRDNGVRKVEREAQRQRDAEEQARIAEARARQSQENQDNANRADETAASVPWVRARDELWDKSPGDASILLDPVERGGG